jgi:hypothetical protein
MRFGPGAVALDPEPILVTGDAPFAIYPEIASDGIRAVIVWSRLEHVYARRFLRDGSSPDPVPIELGRGREYTRPSVAAFADRFVVTWEVPQATTLYAVVVAWLDARTGRAMTAVINSAGDRREPSAWTSGSQAMLGYERFRGQPLADGVARLYLDNVPDNLARRRAVRR